MTVLILAHRKIKDLWPTNIFSKINLNFIVWKQIPILRAGERFTISLLIFAGLVIIVHLWSLYFTIHTGFVLREQGDSLDKLQREVKLYEIQISNFETTLASNPEALNNMEKISSMRYIRTSSEVSYK